MSFTLRRAEPADAAAVIAYMKRLLAEPNHNLRAEPDEFTLTVEEEAEIIREKNTTPNSIFLVAEAEGEIIGVLTCTGGVYRSEKHSCDLGISVAQEWRGMGVGQALMEYAIRWAKEVGLKRIMLFVFARNEGAIRLYERCGFQIEGRLRNDMYKNGEYLDGLVMGLLLDELKNS